MRYSSPLYVDCFLLFVGEQIKLELCYSLSAFVAVVVHTRIYLMGNPCFIPNVPLFIPLFLITIRCRISSILPSRSLSYMPIICLLMPNFYSTFPLLYIISDHNYLIFYAIPFLLAAVSPTLYSIPRLIKLPPLHINTTYSMKINIINQSLRPCPLVRFTSLRRELGKP